jgi:hypothetical protein
VYLERWGVTKHPRHPACEPCLRGLVYGHARFRDGESVISSPIKELRNGRVVTRSGTVYQLGKPAPKALDEAFGINREFAYLVLVLCCISPSDPGMAPAMVPRSPQTRSATLVAARAALSRDDGSSSIQ